MSGGPDEIGVPQKLSAEHDLAGFDSGEPVPMSGFAPALFSAVGAVAHSQAPGRVRRNMPDPVPAMVHGRLAVDKAFQGRHIGAGLLRDAVLRTVQAAEIAGIRTILVHAISAAAKRFYEGYGFAASPVDPLTVMTTIAEAVSQ